MNQRTMEILGEENSALLYEFLDKIKGKSMTQLPPILMEFKSKLPDRQLTLEEKNIIIEEALSTMPAQEQNRYKSMMKILKIV
ncbi:MAG: hypothetical protein FWB74_02270 [Defluviitaleaceae bacterium]|nr:hypothetical protein [Defluviitaleaceae bacterium]